MTKHSFIIIFIIIHCFVNAQNNIAKRIDSLMLALYNNNEFSGQILVGNIDSIIYKRAFGWSNKEKNQINTTKTPTRLASISKSITAMAVMKLHQNKKIDINDRINIYLPEIPYNDILIKHILSHTSGYTDSIFATHWNKFSNYSVKKYGDINNVGFINYLTINKVEKLTSAGEKFSYCNAAYSLLVTLIERVEHSNYDDFLKKNIFNICKMDSSFVFNYTTLKEHSIAFSYNYNNKSIKKTLHYYKKQKNNLVPINLLKGDKHVFSCVDDMYKLDTSFVKYFLFTSIIKKQMTTNLLPSNNEKYGLGWEINNDTSFYFHSGFIEDYVTINSIDEISKHIIIILGNKDFDIYAIRNRITNILNNEAIKELNTPKNEILSKEIFNKTFKIDYKPLYN